MQLLISVSVWPFAHKNTHKNTQERDCTHTPADNSRKKSTHKKHTYTHGQINTNSIYLCGYLLSNNTQQLLLCTHSTIITHKHFLYSPSLSRSGVSVCVCVYMCAKRGEVCGCHRNPTQTSFPVLSEHAAFLSVSVCLPLRLSVCLCLHRALHRSPQIPFSTRQQLRNAKGKRSCR